MKTLVLGLGNPILTDDGIGVKVVESIQQKLPADSSIETGEASLGGLSLMERILGYDTVFLVDAFTPHNGEKNPGEIRRMTLDDLRTCAPTQHSASAHDTSLTTALDMAERLDYPIPKTVIIYAIEVENILDFSEELTPSVAQALPIATNAILKELQDTIL